MTLNSTPLDPVVQDESKLLGTSLHHGLNFTHRDSRFTVFWQTWPTFDFLRGQNTRKYPVLGLEEISNVTSTSPRDSDLLAALNRRDRDAVHITYAQAYTPFTKPLETSTPLSNQPFLLSLLLGKDFIFRQPNLLRVYNSTHNLYELLQLIEAAFLHLSKAEGWLQLVLCSPRIGAIFSFDSRTISNSVSSRNLLLQVSPSL